MGIKAIVVDDEELAREGVIIHLRNESDIEVIAECSNGKEAIEAILSKTPDLVFLDIKMPELSGLDVISAIGPERMPMVIFLTAYNEYAIEAFQINAVDYLLKPINSELFKKSVARARQQMTSKRITEHSQQLKVLLENRQLHKTAINTGINNNERIVVRSHGTVKFLNTEEIYWIKAEGDYIAIHTENKSYLLRDTMRNIEQKLVSRGFQRIHRSIIVQLAIIDQLNTLDNGEYEVILHNDSKLKLSRTYRDALFEQLQNG